MADNRKYDDDPAVSIRFHLKVDDLDVGWWSSVEGLGMEAALEQREEGGNNLWVHQLPTRLKFTNIKLARPINADSAKVATWFMRVADHVPRSATAEIKAVEGDNKTVVAQWNLRGVVPVRWTGPSFNVEGPKMATETIEIAHHGFMDPVAGTG